MANLRRVAPFLLLGPVTGPLVAGVVFNFREGRPVLGSLYAILLVMLTIYLPLITARLGLNLVTQGLLSAFAAQMGVHLG
jgi:hypothetical protein